MTTLGDLAAELAADMATCLRFFSRLALPARAGSRHGAAPLNRALRVLPVAGLVIGAGSVLALLACVLLRLPALLCVVLAGLAAVLVSGGLHEDGLADTADGLGGGSTRERKLAIMRDSRIGSYGVLAIGFSLALRLGAGTAILERSGPAAIVAVLLGAAALSRALALLPLATLPPARADGLGHGIGRPSRAALGVCFVSAGLLGIGLPLAGGLDFLHAALACCGAGAAAAAVTRLAARQIGGHTGDIAGACQQVADAAYLLGFLVVPGAA